MNFSNFFTRRSSHQVCFTKKKGVLETSQNSQGNNYVSLLFDKVAHLKPVPLLKNRPR